MDTQINTESKPSTKLVAEWSGSINVGIYDNCEWSVRLYEDRAIVRMPGVKWQGQTGGYHLYRTRIDRSNVTDSRKLDQLLTHARNEQADGEDYTDEVYHLVNSLY